MSFLDGMKRKKKKPVREDVWDAPTLFGGLGPDAPQAEKKISVLSAAGGKSSRRPRQPQPPARPRSGKRRYAVAALFMVLVGVGAVGVWQSDVLDRNAAAALMSRIDAWFGSEASGDIAGAPTLRVQSAMIPAQSAEASPAGPAMPRETAVIERVALSQEASATPPAPPAAAIESALGEAVTPAARTTAGPARATAATPRTTGTAKNPAANETGRSRPATSSDTGPRLAREESVSLENRSDKKVQVARSKEPDPDAQLLEALLIHLRKTESAKGANR